MRKRTVVADIETNGLYNKEGSPTKVWCIVCKDVDTEEVFKFYQDSLDQFKEFAKGVAHWIGHNFLAYDRRVLLDFFELDLKVPQITDTLILSQIEDPVRKGKHSLERWGEVFGRAKPKQEQWDVWDDNMLHRCVEDVEINFLLYKHLVERLRSYSAYSIRLEHNVNHILNETKRIGWKLDVDKVTQLYTTCSSRVQEIEATFDTDEWPKLPRLDREVKYKVKKDGSVYNTTKKPLQGQEPVGDYSLVEWRQFNPASPVVVREFLDFFGWQPIEKTKAGNWALSEENFKTIPDSAPKAAHSLKDFLVLNSRAKTIGNWLDNTWKDGRVHGDIICPGAASHRAAHRNPNTANPPSASAPYYGKECRESWMVDKGRKLVGIDIDGVQARILSEILDDEEFTAKSLGEKPNDIHTANATALDTTRDKAKRFYYAWILGCRAAKAGQILGRSVSGGKKALTQFIEANPAMKKVEGLRKRWAKVGKYKAKDGRWIKIPSQHKSLAFVLQGEEAIICRVALVQWYLRKNKEGLDADLVGWIHDEFQIDVLEEHAQRAGELMVECIEYAGKKLGYKIPMTGEYKIANDWSGTH